MQQQTKQGNRLRRLGGAIGAVLMLGAGVVTAQQPTAVLPTALGATAVQTAPPPATAPAPAPAAAKPAASATTPPPAVGGAVPGGPTAITGTGSKSDQPDRSPNSVMAEGLGKLGEEGLKMHGHWVIDIKDPDGTLASHHDFENSIQTGGEIYLVALMAGYAVPGDYSISLSQTYSGGASPCISTTGGQYCVLVHSLATQPGISQCVNPGGSICASTLSYTYNLSGAPFDMVLAGQITANATGQIGVVESYVSYCPNNLQAANTLATITPAACPAATATLSNFYLLTATQLTNSSGVPTTVPVTAGQVISITVTISFS